MHNYKYLKNGSLTEILSTKQKSLCGVLCASKPFCGIWCHDNFTDCTLSSTVVSPNYNETIFFWLI